MIAWFAVSGTTTSYRSILDGGDTVLTADIVPTPNFQLNAFYLGDNLPVLRSFDSETVDLIATDPPFNKKRDAFEGKLRGGGMAKFKDNWHWVDPAPDGKLHDPDAIENHPEWLVSIENHHHKVYTLVTAVREVSGDDMAAFLCWLGVRLLEMRRVLKPTGSIYVHIDHTAHAYVKALMDAIFGKQNFRNEIVWGYTGPGSPGMRQFNRKHDTILWYSKSKEWIFNRDAVRIPHKQLNTNRAGRVIADALTSDLRNEYLKKGKVPESWWPDFSPVGRIASERTGYPTQKPLALYERMIRASSNPGDIVLDPFAGCATTAVAAQRLKRNWVAMDIEGEGYEVTKRRMSDERALDQQTIVIGPAITDPPARTDDRRTAADPLNPKPRKQRAPTKLDRDRDHKLGILIEQFGLQCWGCGFAPAKLGTAGERYGREFFHLDHIRPRAEEGTDDIGNRSILCGPCNLRKGGYGGTLADLRRENETAQRLYGPLLDMAQWADWVTRLDREQLP